MSLIERLRPKWHHADPEVRASAVRELGKEDQELLGEVAHQDDDVRVRRIAIKKLEDPRILSDLAQTDPNESLRGLAAERAGSILAVVATSDRQTQVCEDALSKLTDPKHLTTAAATAFHPAIRRAALSRLSDEKALGEVTRTATDPSIREAALSRISSSSVLRRITLSDSPPELAMAALEKISDPDTLLAVAEDRTVQKGVRQRAQAKLDLVVTDDHPIRVKQRREQQLQLCLSVEGMASGEISLDAAEQLRNAQREWENLAVHTEPREPIRNRFQQACQTVLDELARQQRRRQEQERKESELQQDLSARRALCEKVESLEDDEALQELEEAESAWDRLGPAPEGEGQALAERFAQAVASSKERLESSQARQTFRSRLETLVKEAERLAQSAPLKEALRSLPALQKRWAKLEASADEGSWNEEETLLRQRIATAGEQIVHRQREDEERQEQQEQENLTRLEELCSRLEGMASSAEFNMREADRELRGLPASFKIGPLPSSENRNAWQARLSKAQQQLARRLQNQKETDRWRRWANADVQQQLIRQAEALLQVEDLGEVAKELRRIQEEWKRFGTAPRDQSQELWERFRSVRDELRGRCDAYFSENLKKKEELCEKVESLAESTDWNETAEAIKQIQAEWKAIGPVPYKKSEALWARFRKPCDRFFEARNEHFGQLKQTREENEKMKVSLCEKVEAIADSTDWDTVTEEIKRIQAEWKEIGPVDRRKSDALWNRFRAACDHFFDRRKRRGELELNEKLEKGESICVELESFVSSLDGAEAPQPDVARQKIGESWADWSRVGWIPPELAEPVNQRIRKAYERIIAACPESVKGSELDPRTTRKKREKLCARLERLIDSYAATGTPTNEPSVGDLAERLKLALAASAFSSSAGSGKKKDWRSAMQEVERVTANWERLGPIIEEADQALADRFQRARASILELRRGPGGAPERPAARRRPK